MAKAIKKVVQFRLPFDRAVLAVSGAYGYTYVLESANDFGHVQKDLDQDNIGALGTSLTPVNNVAGQVLA